MVLKNLLTDIAGVRVGHADDAKLASGVTAIVFDRPAVAAIDVRGGAPGTREEPLLRPESMIETVDGFALSGGSALGLDAAGGVQAWLAEQGRGLKIRDAVIPIVPGAICFDLLNGGDKRWGRFPPYRDLGYQAAAAASGEFALGSVGAGMGATTATFKGGLGSASAQTRTGAAVAAIAVVNAVGSVTVGDGSVVLGRALRGRRRIWRARPARLLHAGHAGRADQRRPGGDRRREHHDRGGRRPTRS